MSQADEEDTKSWTEDDLKEAIRRINAGEINFKEAENHYGISPRTIHRQRAIENMRAQLNPEKSKKIKTASTSTAKKDLTVLRKPVELSCSSVSDILSLLDSGTEEVKQLLNHECDLIYECKVCKNLFRSLVNFISHKRIYCCDMYSVIHTQSDEHEDGTATDLAKEEKLKAKENFKEFTSRPFRITCRKDLTTVLKRISALSDYMPAEPLLQLQSMENTSYAYQQSLIPSQSTDDTRNPTKTNEPIEEPRGPSQAETKKEGNSTAGKTIDKTPAAILKPVTFYPEKRFRCPLCPSQCTTKKSVLRHLKSVHHKADEQLDKLKPRIQMLYVRKKNIPDHLKIKLPTFGSTATVSLAPLLLAPSVQSVVNVPPVSSHARLEDHNPPISKIKTEPDAEKGGGERTCLLCGRLFPNRNSYAAHMRVCRNNVINNDGVTSNAKSSVSTRALLPVVSLTPVRDPNLSSELNGPLAGPKRKLRSAPANSKQLTLPVSAPSSSSKKIGIQVRMNYCKEGVSQPTSINGTPVPLASPTIVSSQSSAENSRRSSTISVNRDEKPNVLNGHTTRSTTKEIAHILSRLLEKRNVEGENDVPLAVKLSKATVAKKIAKSEVSVYCEDCRKTYALSECKWSSGTEKPRYFKCALGDCDFRSTSVNELWPHLSIRHSEDQLTEMKSTFVVEWCGESEVCRCPDIVASNSGKRPEKTRVVRQVNDATASTTQNAASKRKTNSEPHDQPKRKTVERKLIVSAVKAKPENKTVSENETTKPEMSASKETSAEPVAVTTTNFLVLKKIKRPAKDEGKAARIVRPKKAAVVETPPVGQNGIVTLSSDEDEQPHVNINKLNSKLPNLLSIDTKVPLKLAKSNRLQNEMSPSLTPDSDLDSIMSEEAIMTIIFGKGVPEEKIQQDTSFVREKSPASCSTSSTEAGVDKGHRFRPIKQVAATTVKSSVLSTDRDEKFSKVCLLNKTKASSR